MPAERLSMRQIREVLRLCYGIKLPQRAADRIVHRAHRIELRGPSLRRHLVAAESPVA
jgi:hypothetical protein